MSSAGVKSSGGLTSKSSSSITMSRPIENEGNQQSSSLAALRICIILISEQSVLEEKMLAKGYITPDDVLQLKKITSGMYKFSLFLSE